jgi:hypothetical protein
MENKFRAQTCAGKFIASSFRESEGTCLVEFFKRGATVNSERYVQILKKLKQPILRFWPNMKMNQVVIPHDNTRRHTSMRTEEAVATVG